MVKGPSEPEAPLHTTSASRTKVQRRAFFNRRSPLTQPPPGIAAHPANDDDEYCEDLQGLRVALNAGLQNVGVLAAFMTSLSGAIYVSLPHPNACMGMSWLRAELVLAWMSMGCFFFTIISAVILSDDLDGIPDQLLVRHVRNIRYVHVLPNLGATIGIWTMAIAYGIDIGVRGSGLVQDDTRRKAAALAAAGGEVVNDTGSAAAGRPDSPECIGFKTFGLVAAPGFVIVSCSLAFVMRYYRRRLRYQGWENLGFAILCPWHDRYLLHGSRGAERGRVETVQVGNEN